MSDHRKNESGSFASKRCPECFTQLPLDTEICTSCGMKIGKVDKYGLAKKPVDWLSYVLCLLSWVGLAVFVWWAFF
ncbi:MAG TPA: hypothetical protein PKV75_06660 [Desulfobacterales bacterium]|nr:hypothetical protein [Desulfobacterales bacterium]